MEPLGPVKANHLLEHEVDYELDIRDCFVQRPAKEKRTILSRLLAKEREKQRAGSLIVSGAHKYTLEKEKSGIDKTLTSLRELISDFEGTCKDPLFARIRSRLNHVSGRALHFPVPEASSAVEGAQSVGDDAAEVISFRKDTFATCLQLEAELLEKAEKSGPSRPSSPFSLPVPVVNVAPPVVSCSAQKVPISEWGLKFNGDARSLYYFLERVSLLAQSREVSDEDLFKSAVEFFVGDAFAWYKCIRSSVNNWSTLVDRLKQDFLPLDADDDIWSQIKNRKQKRNESVHIFIAHLDTLFCRLSRPPADVSKVKYIRQNLLPEFSSHLGLQDINSVNELVALCRKLEDNLNLRSRPSTSQNISTLTSNDNHLKNNNSQNVYDTRSKHTNSKNNSKPNFYRKNNKPSSSDNSKNKKQESLFICWNCDQANHHFSDCKLKRKIFCYKCGNKNFKFSSCPKCKQKNE